MRRRPVLLTFMIAALALPTDRIAAAPPPALDKQVRAEIEAALSRLPETGDFAEAEAVLQEQFDRVIFYAAGDRKDLFRDAALALRLVRQLGELDTATAVELLAFLRQRPTLVNTLVFLVDPEHENPTEIYTLLDRLRRQRGDRLEKYANLAAAVCVVHDRPLKRRINENSAQSGDPLDVFDYFVTHERYMLFPVRKVPAQLLVYVVDTTATIEEMQWALGRYAGDPAVGDRFFDIKYDRAHFRTGTPKKVTQAGWNLPNILKYGGVCVDQAYFAMTVGKSIGVPTAYATGASSKTGHAWVGFLQARGDHAWWNFDVGRYKAYQGVRGTVMDPQVRRRIPDSYVSLLAEHGRVSPADRRAAAAYTDAALRLLELAETAGETVVGGGQPEAAVRRADVQSTLDLVEIALRASPGYGRGWTVVGELAANDMLTLQQKKRWATVLHRLCGQRYPDFYLSVLSPMIETIDDVNEQNAMWNKAFALFDNRHDLAASVRMRQGRMWDDAGEPDKAGACYENVIDRYSNAGPFVIQALKAAEQLLLKEGNTRKVLRLYNRAFDSISKPPDKSGPFYRRSNFYRVGMLFARKLEKAGYGRQAATVRASVQAVVVGTP